MNLLLQIALGIGLIINGRYNINQEEVWKADRNNNFTLTGIRLTDINAVIFVIFIVACFANAGTVEARSIESRTQQKENECL
jgi:hypothetical protein